MDPDEGLRRFRVAQRSFAAEEVAIRSENFATASSRRVAGLIQQSNAVHRGQRPEEENVQIVHRFYHVAPPPLVHVRSDVVPRISDRALPIMAHHSAFSADIHLGFTNTSQGGEIGIHEGIAAKYRMRPDPGVLNTVAPTKYELPPDEQKPAPAETAVQDAEDASYSKMLKDVDLDDSGVVTLNPNAAGLRAARLLRFGSLDNRPTPLAEGAVPPVLAEGAPRPPVSGVAPPPPPEGAPLPFSPAAPGGPSVSPITEGVSPFLSSTGLGAQAEAANQGEEDQSRQFDNAQASVLASSQVPQSSPPPQASVLAGSQVPQSSLQPQAPSSNLEDASFSLPPVDAESINQELDNASQMAEMQRDLMEAAQTKIDNSGDNARIIGMVIWTFMIESLKLAQQGAIEISQSQFISLVLIFCAMVSSVKRSARPKLIAQVAALPDSADGQEILNARVTDERTREIFNAIARAVTPARMNEVQKSAKLLERVITPGKNTQRLPQTPTATRSLSFATPGQSAAPSNAAAAAAPDAAIENIVPAPVAAPDAAIENIVAVPVAAELGGKKLPLGIFTSTGRKIFLYEDGTFRPSKQDGSPAIPAIDLKGLRIGAPSSNEPGAGGKTLKENDSIYRKLTSTKTNRILAEHDPATMASFFDELVKEYGGIKQGNASKPTDVSPPPAYGSGSGKPLKRGRFEKGSAEAKAFMAELRAKRKKM